MLKTPKKLKIIGLMSGTSMDGINSSFLITNGLSVLRKNYNNIYNYSEETSSLLREFEMNPNTLLQNLAKRINLNKLITIDHANAVKFFCTKFKVKPDIIGFHGQTIVHNPKSQLSIQLGDGELLSKLTNTKVVYDFRTEDIQNGGEGAPLAPIYHKYLMEELDLKLPACFINIGGVSNITYLDNTKLIGFDCGPGNALMDKLIQTKTNFLYDDGGKIASTGKVSGTVISKHLADKYFFKRFPKSIDKFDFIDILKTLEEKELSLQDSLSTLAEISALSIAQAIKILPQNPYNVVITGGGMYNSHLISRIKKHVKSKVRILDKNFINGNYVESELIAFLAARVIYSFPNTFPSTTGVKKPIIGGKVIYIKA